MRSDAGGTQSDSILLLPDGARYDPARERGDRTVGLSIEQLRDPLRQPRLMAGPTGDLLRQAGMRPCG
jgi:hypothetical protein